VTDRQTDGQTDKITTPKTALAYARAVKTFKGANIEFQILKISTSLKNRKQHFVFVYISRVFQKYCFVI